jgi:hypothetical protein
MSKKVIAVFAMMVFALVAGCESEKGNGFVGHWVEVNGSDAKPMTLDISYQDNVFHIDEKKSLFGKEFESKLEGKADSATTLSAKGGALTLRLDDAAPNHLFYKGRELTKSP